LAVVIGIAQSLAFRGRRGCDDGQQFKIRLHTRFLEKVKKFVNHYEIRIDPLACENRVFLSLACSYPQPGAIF
jgi:hypothetical protein